MLADIFQREAHHDIDEVESKSRIQVDSEGSGGTTQSLPSKRSQEHIDRQRTIVCAGIISRPAPSSLYMDIDNSIVGHKYCGALQSNLSVSAAQDLIEHVHKWLDKELDAFTLVTKLAPVLSSNSTIHLLDGLNDLFSIYGPFPRIHTSFNSGEEDFFVLINQEDSRIYIRREPSSHQFDQLFTSQEILESKTVSLLSAKWAVQLLQSELTVTESLETSRRKRCMQTLQRLAQHFRVLPPSLFIRNLDCDIQKHPVNGGGCADIFKGHLDGKPVCVKSLRVYQFQVNDISQRNSIIKAFCREALVWTHLSHPNVLPCFGITTDFNSSFCLVSPWMSNGNIMHFLQANPNHDKHRAIREVASGIEYLHGLTPQVVHGDIKCANILINNKGCCCLADFGLALTIESQTIGQSSDPTRGTVRWLAPEVLLAWAPMRQGSRPASKTARDIYAFACTVLEIFTGEIPFAEFGNDAAVILEVVSGRRPIRPSSLELTDEMWSLICDCWAEDSRARPFVTDVLKRLDDVDSKIASCTLGKELEKSQKSPNNNSLEVKEDSNVPVNKYCCYVCLLEEEKQPNPCQTFCYANISDPSEVDESIPTDSLHLGFCIAHSKVIHLVTIINAICASRQIPTPKTWSNSTDKNQDEDEDNNRLRQNSNHSSTDSKATTSKTRAGLVLFQNIIRNRSIRNHFSFWTRSKTGTASQSHDHPPISAVPNAPVNCVLGFQFPLADQPKILNTVYRNIRPGGMSQDALWLLSEIHKRHGNDPLVVALESSPLKECYDGLHTLLSKKRLDDDDTMAALTIVTSFAFDGGCGEWEDWLEAACNYCRELLGRDPAAALTSCTDQQRLLVELSIWFDVIASVTTLKAPRLLNIIRVLCRPNGDSPFMYVMGHHKIVVWAMAEISMLAFWKQELKPIDLPTHDSKFKLAGKLSSTRESLIGKVLVIRKYLNTILIKENRSGRPTWVQSWQDTTAEMFRIACHIYLSSLIFDNLHTAEVGHFLDEYTGFIRTTFIPTDNPSIIRNSVLTYYICGCFTDSPLDQSLIRMHLRLGAKDGHGSCNSVLKMLENIWKGYIPREESVPWRKLIHEAKILLA